MMIELLTALKDIIVSGTISVGSIFGGVLLDSPSRLVAAIVGGIAAGVSAVLLWNYRERQQDIGTWSVIKSEFENYVRHAKASERRLRPLLDDVYQTEKTTLTKVRFFEEGFLTRNRDDLVRLPENLRLFVMRTQLFIRNTDTDIDFAIERLFDSTASIDEDEAKRLLGALIDRLVRSSQDSARVAEALTRFIRQRRSYEDKELDFID